MLVKFTLNPMGSDGPSVQRWQDLLLAEHLALETLRDAGIDAARSWICDHAGQRFLEVERFDRVGLRGRRALFSLAALDAGFLGDGRSPWPVVISGLAQRKVVTRESTAVAQRLHAFGRLIGNTDMHQGNLSCMGEHGRPYALAPAYDMLPMAFAPASGGAIGNKVPAPELHPGIAHTIWAEMRVLARTYVARLRADTRMSGGFQPCVDALEQHLHAADRLMDRLA